MLIGFAVLGLLVMAWAVLGLIRDRPPAGDFGSTGGYPPARHPAAAVPADPAGPAAPPVTLVVPAIGVRAPVLPVDSVDGSLGVPDDPAQVGWWVGSALPGSVTGTVVLDGHVDTVAGPGALFRLTDLRAGDTMTVQTASGRRMTYAVTGRRIVAKTAGLPADVFSPDTAPRLAVITCGGTFDRTTHSYRDNIVLFASPTEPAA
jgi:Sortase domain